MCRGGESNTLRSPLPRQTWTISSPFVYNKHEGAGRLYGIIVGTHPLVSTPFKKLKPFLTWLGIIFELTLKSFPRIHPVFQFAFQRKAPKI